MEILAVGIILGIVLGSFAKATADRVITNRSILGRSYCLQCKHKLKWYDLFPVFSFIFLKGKCRYCHKKIPLSNFLVEIVMGVAVALLFSSIVPPITPLLILDLFFKLAVVLVLALIFLIDLETGLIPDKITYPAIIFTSLYIVISYGLQSIMSLVVAVILALSFSLLIILTNGKGMGWGDVKYVLFLGLALGFPDILVGVFLAFLTGAIISVGLIIFGRKHFGQTIPFGPFLSIGAYISLLYGTEIINWYLQSF